MTCRNAFLVLLVSLIPSAAVAQSSHWGVRASLTPKWKVPTQLAQLFDGTVDITGSEFTVGIVRGRDLGGDWGVSYARKTLKDGSRIEKFEPECFSNGCFESGTSYRTRGVTLSGVKVHKYVPVITIKECVQIGMNFAGGVGQFQGDLDTLERDVEISGDHRTARQTETITTEPASELIPVSVLPLADLEAAVAVSVAPGLKLRMEGGLSFPGYRVFNVTAVYFFGAR